MTPDNLAPNSALPVDTTPAIQATWSTNVLYLWRQRRSLIKAGLWGLVLSCVVSLILPKQYESGTTIMPPEQSGGASAVLSALARSSSSSAAGAGAEGAGGLAALAGSLLGGLGVRSSGELLMDLMHSGSIGNTLADRFQLQHLWHQRYRKDTLKKLARRTDIKENKKSGIISITVTDEDPARAQSMAQAYVEELNKLLARVNTSSARRERQFIEGRLVSAGNDLNDAEQQLSKFSTKNSTIDIKEQTHAMVDAAAKLQAQLIVARADVESLRQIYGDSNVRVKGAEERVGVVQRELNKMAGSATVPTEASADELYPPLRQLPQLGVQYADLYRRVRVRETVFDLLSAQYESARIQEAKEIGTVSVVDAAGLPETKTFPKRRWTTLGGGVLAFVFTGLFLLLRKHWDEMEEHNELKIVAREVLSSLPERFRRFEKRHA